MLVPFARCWSLTTRVFVVLLCTALLWTALLWTGVHAQPVADAGTDWPAGRSPWPAPPPSGTTVGPPIVHRQMEQAPLAFYAGESAVAPFEGRMAADPHADASSETLDDAWAIALRVDQQLESRRWQVSSAEESVLRAQAERWPLLNLGGDYTVRDNEPAFNFDLPGLPVPMGSFPHAQREAFSMHSTVKVPLYTSGRISCGIEAAQAEVTARVWDVASSTLNLKMRVAVEYIDVLRAQRDLDVAESSLKSLEAHVHDVEMLRQHDRVPRSDLLSAQVAHANTQLGRIEAANRLDVSRAAYNRRLGRPLTSPVELAELPPPHFNEDLDSLTARAIAQRPELAQLSAQAEALRYQAGAVRAGSRPQFDVLGQFAYEENRFRSPDGITSVGVGVSWNLFDSGRSGHEAAALSDRAEGLLRMLADLESHIRLNARRAWLDVEQTRQRLAVTQQALERAENNLSDTRSLYAAGRGTNTEVLDAVAQRTETNRNHYNALYDSVLAVLRLRRVAGDL